MAYSQTVLEEKRASVSIGICATTELKNTLALTDTIMGYGSLSFNLVQLIVATPNPTLAHYLTGRDPRIVVEFENKREGKAAALNRVLKRASGDIVVLASADIGLARGTISRLVEGLVEHSDWGVVDSRVELLNGDRLLMDRVSNLLWDVHNRTLDELDGEERLGHVAGDLLAVRRGLIDSLPLVTNDDAFLALKVRERGFRVKRVGEALVWIVGPRNPADYISQRSRILRGHFEIIKIVGKMPSTFEFQILRRPRHYLKMLVKTVGPKGPSGILSLLVAGILEILSMQLAFASKISKRRSMPWRIAPSTKEDLVQSPLPRQNRDLPEQETRKDQERFRTA